LMPVNRDIARIFPQLFILGDYGYDSGLIHDIGLDPQGLYLVFQVFNNAQCEINLSEGVCDPL